MNNNQYFRVTVYHPAENTTIIMDCYGLYDELWKFSSDLCNKKGFEEIIEVGKADKFLDVNFTKAEYSPGKYILRAYADGKPIKTTHLLNGITYHAIKVADKIYIPDKSKRV